MYRIVAAEPFTTHHRGPVKGRYTKTHPAGHVCGVRTVRNTAERHARKNTRMFGVRFIVEEVGP